ncbi:Uncharacterised protein [Mycobacteroides abscessus subsp. abscessus]|nr:Uncharacterised protein [Mycobacteroides abscessus subsp. abscessus]
MVWVVGMQSNPAISGAKETGQLGEPDRLAPVNMSSAMRMGPV